MSFEFSNDIPIYIQIIEHIKLEIISKKYCSGQKLPSVRELSLVFGVNPNTIQKSMQELEDVGIIYTDRTNGKYVTLDQFVIDSIAQKTLNEKVKAFFEDMSKLGFDKEQVIKLLNEENLWVC